MSGTCSRSAAWRRTYESRRSANCVSPRRTTAGSPSRITCTSCALAASICDTRLARSGRARSSDISRDTSWPRWRSMAGGAVTGVTRSPSMIGRSQSAYRGPYSSMTVPAASIRNRSVPARAMPIGTRSRNSTTMVPGSRRRSVASATHADANSLERQRSRSAASRLWPFMPSSRAATSPACTPLVALARECAARGATAGRPPPPRPTRPRRRAGPPARPPSRCATRGARAGAGAGWRESGCGGSGDRPARSPTCQLRPPARRPRASSTRGPTVPMDPAPRVMTASPGRASAVTRADDVVERPGEVQPARELRADGLGQRLDGHAGDRDPRPPRRCP